MMQEMAKAKLRVKELAESAGITKPHALELAMGISSSKASRLWDGEMDKIALDTIFDLCEFFRCSPTDLFTRADGKKWRKDIFR